MSLDLSPKALAEGEALAKWEPTQWPPIGTSGPTQRLGKEGEESLILNLQYEDLRSGKGELCDFWVQIHLIQNPSTSVRLSAPL